MSPTNYHNSLYINSCLKRNIDVLQTRLVCNEKKPCLQSKEALFVMQRSLVCKPPIFTWLGKQRNGIGEASGMSGEKQVAENKKAGRPARNNAKATRNSYSTILNCRLGCCFGRDARPYVYPKSVIRPKQACCKNICLSFPLFSAFVSSSCRRPRFDIARYAFNTGVASCSKQRRSRAKI